MVAKREIEKTQIYQDFDQNSIEFWFDFKQKKFLHNIDTFYYSVKFRNDFRLKSKDPQVEKMRKFFKLQYNYLNGNEDQPELHLPKLGKNLYLKPVTFSRFYTTCLSYPEYFDIFLAPVVPKAADGGESVTCECVVQIRSYMLWIMGVKDAFENSYRYVKNIAEYFGLEIDFVSKINNDISLIEVKATTGNTKSAKTVLKNSQYDVNICYKLSENNIGVAENIITIPYYMTFLL